MSFGVLGPVSAGAAAAAAASAAASASVVASNSASPSHTCGCDACMRMTHALTFGQITSFFLIIIGVVLVVVAGVFLAGLLFKKFGI